MTELNLDTATTEAHIDEHKAMLAWQKAVLRFRENGTDENREAVLSTLHALHLCRIRTLRCSMEQESRVVRASLDGILKSTDRGVNPREDY